MSTTNGWILITLGAILLTGCGGSGGGAGNTGATPPGSPPPIIGDVTDSLDFNTGGFDSIDKPPRRDPDSDNIAARRPVDLDAGTPYVDNPTNPEDIRSDNFGSRNDPGGIKNGGPGVGNDDDGKGGPDDEKSGEITGRPLPDGFRLGEPTVIPPVIDPPHQPAPPVLTSAKNRFDEWIITDPPPPEGPPPTGDGPNDLPTAEPISPNFPGAITAGGDDRKGDNGDEEPVPEASTVILMLVGLASLYFLKKRS